MRSLLIAACAIAAASAQPDVSQVVIVPRASSTGVVVTIAGAVPAAGTNLVISARDSANRRIFPEKRTGVSGNVVDVGDFPTPPSGTVKFDVSTSNAYANHITQTFNVDASAATYIASLAWVSSGTQVTLEAIPSSNLPARARWSARCAGVPDVIGRPWRDRTIPLENSQNCTAAVTMDKAGFVTTDPMIVSHSSSTSPLDIASGASHVKALVALGTLACIAENLLHAQDGGIL